MLRKYFPSTAEGAALYGGYMETGNTFGKVYKIKETLGDTLQEINLFLQSNGYSTVKLEDFDDTNCYRKHPVAILQFENPKDIFLYLGRDHLSISQTDFFINELRKFRDERDWNQFHNPKDLAIALSIEANELLEQYLWKKPEEANMEKVEKELADVFAYAFLLADKLQLNVEEILLRKIQHNGEKYPVEKAKGTASKYNEL